MTGAAHLLDPFVRGLAVGALFVLAAGVWRGAAGRGARGVTLATALSLAAWLVTESPPLWDAFGAAYLLLFLAYPVAGLFWLFVVAAFEDRTPAPAHLLPAIVMGISGVLMGPGPPPYDPLWITRNVAGGALCLHAGFIVVRGWRGDLLEARRGLRGVLLGLTVLFGVFQTLNAFALRLDPSGPWLGLTTGELYGGAILAALILTIVASFVSVGPGLFVPVRSAPAVPDARLEAADALLLQKINDLMAAGLWRRERLAIGDLAAQVGEGEHRVRRLINQRLGHRNFAEFVNAHRIEAAKQRLGDPAEARTTISALAFDLGFGSLGPFNRAFRAATGSTPTQWRQTALGALLDSTKAR